MSFDWKSTLATVAPTIATAFGGPLAGVAVNMVADALGVEPDSEVVQKAIASGNPEIMLKLKQAENDFVLKLEELGIERDRLVVQNTDSARKMQIETKSLIPAILSIVTVIGFFGLLIGASLGALTLTGSDVMMLLLGVLARETASVYNFWLGSSRGSQEKTALLGKQK